MLRSYVPQRETAPPTDVRSDKSEAAHTCLKDVPTDFQDFICPTNYRFAHCFIVRCADKAEAGGNGSAWRQKEDSFITHFRMKNVSKKVKQSLASIYFVPVVS